MTEAAADWYIVQTRSQGERRAATALRRAGYRVWIPKARRDVRNRRTGTWRRVHVQLMPGYILVRLTRLSHDGKPDWMALHTADGVVSVLGCGGSPTAFPRHLVRRMMIDQRRRRHDALHQNGSAMRKRQLERLYPAGSLVRINDGPFGGLSMTVTRIPGHSMITGDLTGWGLPVTVDAEHVVRIEEREQAKAA
ncbi:MAG: transcription termination/antitermination NusG family protein [Opitutaceae bacterium]